MRGLYPVLKGVMKNSSITSEELAKALYLGGTQGAGKQVMENKEIKEILE